MMFNRTHAHLLSLAGTWLVAASLLALACEAGQRIAPFEEQEDQGQQEDDVVRLVIEPGHVTVQVNDSTEFSAYVLTASGDTADVEVLWSTTDGSVTSKGKGKGKALGHYKAGGKPGKDDVIASADSGQVADTAEVEVVESLVESVTVSPGSATVVVGGRASLTATVRDADGNELTGREVTWTSSATGIATVDQGGLVTAVAEGSATITATSEGVSGTAGITVTAAATSATWEADMETGDLSEWALPADDNGGGEFNSDGGDSEASQDIARTGTWSAKMVLADGSGGTRLFRWHEPRENPEAYYSAWFYFPERYEPESWWNIFQFKSKVSEATNDPFWVLNVGNRADGAMFLYLYDWQNQKSYDQEQSDLPVGQWVHIECYLRQSADDTGRLTCWQDGVVLWDLTDISTKYAAGDNQWSINNYSSAVSPTPVVIYVDDVAIRIGAESPES